MCLIRWVAAAALNAAAFVPPPAQASEAHKAHAELVLDAIDGHIIPRLERLRESTMALASALKTFCADRGDGAHRESVEASFKSTVTGWGGIDFLRFGPASEANRLERFFFWPDPRAVTERQLQALLSRRDTTLLDLEVLVKQSVAVQGLGALELILFDDKHPILGDDDDAQYRCAFGAAIGANLETVAGEIESGWTAPHGWREKMLAAGSDNPLYKDASETARDVVRALLTGLQLAQDRHVMPRLEAALASSLKPPRVPFSRSGMNVQYFEAEIASLAALFDVTGLIAYVPADKRWMRTFIPRAFETLSAEGASLSQLDRAAPHDEEGIVKLRKMRFSLNGLRQIINRELAPAADLVLGFNELDGD